MNETELIPLVVFHVNGNQQYFKNCINLSSSKNKVYLIGDNSNMNTFVANKNVEFVNINDLKSNEISEFEKYFINYSTNDFKYELNCFLRVFYLKCFFEKMNFKKVFHTDSDCIILENINNIFTINDNIAYSIVKNNIYHMAGSIHNALLDINFCNKFIELCFDIYKNKTKFNLIEPKIKWHTENNIAGGVCDMTLYYLIYYEKIIDNIIDLNEKYFVNGENVVFDHTISISYGFNGENTYKMINRTKEIQINENKCYFVTNDNDLIRTISIHYQGDSKRILESSCNSIKTILEI